MYHLLTRQLLRELSIGPELNKVSVPRDAFPVKLKSRNNLEATHTQIMLSVLRMLSDDRYPLGMEHSGF